MIKIEIILCCEINRTVGVTVRFTCVWTRSNKNNKNNKSVFIIKNNNFRVRIIKTKYLIKLQ
jgi:hypothetical protein